MHALCLLLAAALSIWDYPARQPRHRRLAHAFAAAVRAGDVPKMSDACRQGVKLLPEDPTWRYNLACAEARSGNTASALASLERAIDLGFRNAKAIAEDGDFQALRGDSRFRALVDYARRTAKIPAVTGPLSAVPAEGAFGTRVTLSAQNLGWDFESGSFVAHLALTNGAAGGNAGDLYVNRDAGHSVLRVTDFPGVTPVAFDADGRAHGADLDFPNTLYPHPVFGNCSRALTEGALWRSVPRALMTNYVLLLPAQARYYLSNQVWVFPANADCPPVGTHGDVFASVTPYWFQSAGASWSDQGILRATLEASRSFKPAVKADIVKRGLLAPTMQTLVRHALRGVTDEAAYLGAAAHPTAFDAGRIDVARLKAAAAALTAEAIPPLAPIAVRLDPPADAPSFPEVTYVTPFAAAAILRADEARRTLTVSTAGAKDTTFACACVHGDARAVSVSRTAPNAWRVSVDRAHILPTNRVDLAVFARTAKTDWGAPSFVSLAVIDPKAGYADPALLPRP